VKKRPFRLGLREQTPASMRPLLLVALPILALATWVTLTEFVHVSTLVLPGPVQTLKALLNLFFEQGLLAATLISAKRIVLAVGLSALIALPLGVLMGAFDPVNRLFDPLMAPLRYMPISAFIPLLIVWFGIGEEQKIAFLFLGTFVYLLPSVVDAVRAVPEELIHTAYTLGASRARVVMTVLVPASMPSIFDSFRTLNAIAWTYVILAELVNPSGGLGAIFSAAYRTNKPDWSIAGLAVVGVIGLLSDRAIDGVNRVLFRWRD
jgi:NitT/TauT family transport system permease protein